MLQRLWLVDLDPERMPRTVDNRPAAPGDRGARAEQEARSEQGASAEQGAQAEQGARAEQAEPPGQTRRTEFEADGAR
jgi:hypothetical protein